jgi:hypothetical protein
MWEADHAADRRGGTLRVVLRHVGRTLWQVLRVLALVMMAVGPSAPPPPLPRPPPIEARAQSSEEDGEEP